jgi:hypothetical protein
VRARKYGKGRFESAVLHCPAKNGTPDYERMAELTRQTAAFPIIASFRKARQASVKSRFNELVKAWKDGRGHTSSLARLISHPAYQEIIRLGRDAVPLLLAELQTAPDHWFPALTSITGQNPVLEGDAGVVSKMTAAWIQWGEGGGC